MGNNTVWLYFRRELALAQSLFDRFLTAIDPLPLGLVVASVGGLFGGEGERILPAAIVEKFVAGLGGELVPLVKGSTRAVAQVRAHAGIVKVKRYAFGMP